MKTALFATSALCAAGLACAASAAEWETGVSGYYFLGVGVTDSGAQDGVGVLRDGEFHVNGRLAADNGIVFAARIEVEAFTSADQIDENWGRIIGPFGAVTIGSDASVGYEQVGALGIVFSPGGRVGYADAFALTSEALVNEAAFMGFATDSIGLHYSSPDFFGFQVHGSYIPSANTDGAADTNNPALSANDEVWSLAATYAGEFNEVSFGLGGHYTDQEGVAGEQIGAAGYVGFSGITLAGFYEDDFAGDEFGIGAQYETGPWAIGGGYSNSNQLDNEIASAWVTYSAAPGVQFTVGLEYADDDSVAGSDFGGLAYMSLFF